MLVLTRTAAAAGTAFHPGGIATTVASNRKFHPMIFGTLLVLGRVIALWSEGDEPFLIFADPLLCYFGLVSTSDRSPRPIIPSQQRQAAACCRKSP